MVSGRTLITSKRHYFFFSLGLHESTVGVALGSHIAERKRVRADGVRNSVFYSTSAPIVLHSFPG